MKTLSKLHKIFLCVALSLPFSRPGMAQDLTKKDLLVDLSYHNLNNEVAYLTIHAKTKTAGKFQPVEGAKLRLFLDKDSAGCEAGSLVTDSKGSALTTLSPSLKDRWNSAATHTFIAISDAGAIFNASRTETPVTKAHLVIDTGTGRTITATLEEYKNAVWTPVKAVEIKLAVKRSGSDLALSDKDTYTTDSTGKVEAEYKRDSLPGDKNGFFTLVAKVEDNDTYGNLRVEKTVPWGTVLKPDTTFNARTLWAARFRTPVWLLLMEYFIFISVWLVIIYLLFQIAKMRRAGIPGTHG